MRSSLLLGLIWYLTQVFYFHFVHANLLLNFDFWNIRNWWFESVQWNDSSLSHKDEYSNNSKRLHLPSPKKIILSFITLPKPKRLCKYRNKFNWSLLEEDALREGVKMYVWILSLSLFNIWYANIFRTYLTIHWWISDTMHFC